MFMFVWTLAVGHRGEEKDRVKVISVALYMLLCTLGPCVGETAGIPGNVTVVGMFQVMRQGGTAVVPSVMAVEAIKWYLGALNGAGALPFTVGFEAIATDGSSGAAGEAAVLVANRALQTSTGDKLVAFIGPETSAEAEAVSRILSSVGSDERLLQVVYSASSGRLTDHTLLPNIYHVVPVDDTQIEVMLQTIQSLEWNRIAVVYEDDVYDKARADGLNARAEVAEICVALMRTVYVDASGHVDINTVQSAMDDIVMGTTDDGTTINPINGVVVFASASTTNVLLSVTNSMGVTGVPIFLLSAATQLQLDVFRQNGQILQKTKGSLLVSPTYREITEFSDHWKSLFTNSTMFTREVLTNPWLQDVHDDISDCASRPCDFEPMPEETMKEMFPKQPVSISYAISAVHTVVKAIQAVHEELCNGASDMCAGFIANLKPGMVLEAMKDVRVNMAEDFSFSLGSAARMPALAFNDAGELQLLDDISSYQLYNFKQNSEQGVGVIKVGDYISDLLNVNKDLIRDYASDGAEKEWPDTRKARCMSRKTCTECIQNHLADRSWHIPGDVYFVGLAPVNDKLSTGCGDMRLLNGYQIAESLLFAVKTANDSFGIYSNNFKNLNIGLIILNSCNNAVVAQRKILDLHKYGLPLGGGQFLDLSGKIIGYIGSVSSDLSIAASQVLKPLGHVQISYGSSSAYLSNREEHPYFMRVVTADTTQAEAMMLLVKELNGEYIQVIHTQGAYGEAGKDQVVYQAKLMGICIANTIMVPESSIDDYYGYYEQLRKYPFAKLVIVFVQSWIARPFLSDLGEQMVKGDFQFIGSQSWGKQPMVLSDDVDQNLLGSFTFALEIAQNAELLSYLRQMKPTALAVSPWATAYVQTLLGCYAPDSFDKSSGKECTEEDSLQRDPDFAPDPWTSPAYDALLSLFIGAGSFHRRVCGDAATTLCSAFLNDPTGIVEETVSTVKLDIHGDGNPVRVFDDNGDGAVGYTVYNIQRDADDPQKLVYKKVGQYDGKLVINTDNLVYPMPDLYESRCPNEQACAGCFDTGDSSKDTSPENVGMIVLGALLAVAVVAIVVLTIVLRRQCVKSREEAVYITPDNSLERSETPGGYHSSDMEGEANAHTVWKTDIL